MKTNGIHPTEKVLKEIAKTIYGNEIALLQPQNENLNIDKDKLKWIFPIYELNSQHNKTKIQTDDNSWIVYDEEKELIYEFFQNGALGLFYPTDEVFREMTATLSNMQNEFKKAALLRVNALQLNFWWFGKEIPLQDKDDHFVLFGNNKSKFKKQHLYGSEEFKKIVETEIEFFKTRWHDPYQP